MRHFVLSIIISLSFASTSLAQAYIIRPYTSGSGASCAGLVTPGTYGSATVIPVLTIDSNGCISVITTATPFAKGTLTASSPFEFTQTWNNGATIFSGLKLAITNTASDIESEMLGITVNGTNYLSLRRSALYLPVNVRYCTTVYTDCSWWIDTSVSDTFGINAVSGAYTIALRGMVTGRNYSGEGFSPTVTGDGTEEADSWDFNGAVISTVTGAGTITVTFGYTTLAPHKCIVQNNTTPNNVTLSTTTSALVISGTFVTGDRITYICTGK